MTSPDIRIGTMVKGGPNTARDIAALLPLGFESFQISFQTGLGDTDLACLAGEVMPLLAGSGATVSSLAVFGNPLGELEKDQATRDATTACIAQAGLFGSALVCGFTGRVRGRPIPESLAPYRETFGRFADDAGALGVRIAFENCPMRGTWESGDFNIAFHPGAWELMFEALPAPNVGLEWEPCHQLKQLIDPRPQIRQWGKRIFHVHGKDGRMLPWNLARHGIFSPEPYMEQRFPGLGDSDWAAIVSDLRAEGFAGAIDIEGWHDPVYRGEREIEGQVAALNYLKICRDGLSRTEGKR